MVVLNWVTRIRVTRSQSHSIPRVTANKTPKYKLTSTNGSTVDLHHSSKNTFTFHLSFFVIFLCKMPVILTGCEFIQFTFHFQLLWHTQVVLRGGSWVARRITAQCVSVCVGGWHVGVYTVSAVLESLWLDLDTGKWLNWERWNKMIFL